MATYFQANPEIPAADGLQTLVLMNPGYVPYSDTPPPASASNLLFLNSAAGGNSLSSQNLPTHTQQFVSIPLSVTTSQPSQDPSSQSIHAHHDVSPLHGFVPRFQYNLWNPMDPSAAAREIPRAHQGLSLSLSSQQPAYGSFRPDRDTPQGISGEDMRISGGSSSSASGVTACVTGMQGVLLSSKYLRAAQELLDEVVNVGSNGIKSESLKKIASGQQSKQVGESSSSAAAGEGSTGKEAAGKQAAELSTAERQEIQMKKAKLIGMLDEVEQRYRQYHHQMQIVISSFEQAAGIGSARTYTALALQTISKQFRCLKDTIMGQIRLANKNLGEEDSLGGKIEGSRLKYVDHHLRQQRALQQLGMIQHNAWRPQRGLPERAVSVLRAWLFEHFLHPYPKDSDKHMLAKQTGLTRSQVSNWFINARVRLWKPMVEEMYNEEIKDHEQNGSADKTSKSNEDSASEFPNSQDKSPATGNQTTSFISKQENSTPVAISISTAGGSPMGGKVRNQSTFSLIGSSELEGMTQGSPKKQRSSEMLHSPTSLPSINMDVKHGEANGGDHVTIKFNDDRQNKDGYSFLERPPNFFGGFGQYPMGELGRFDADQFTKRFSGNGVSLTLGLPHCENLPMSGTHQSFLPNQNLHMGRRVDMGEPNEFGAINTSMPHSSTAFENINIQNQKRFAAQLLPDFVA